MQFPSFMGLVAGTGGTREEVLEVPLRLGLAIGIVQSELNLRAEVAFLSSLFNIFLRCGNLNFSSRTKCNGTLPNGEVGHILNIDLKESITINFPDITVQACLLAKPEFEKYGVAMVKSKMMHKDGDWNCFRCGNVNFQVLQIFIENTKL